MADPKRRSVFERLQEQQTRRSVFDRVNASGPEAEMVVGEPEIIKTQHGASGSWDAPEPDEASLMDRFINAGSDSAYRLANGVYQGNLANLAGSVTGALGGDAQAEERHARERIELAKRRTPWLSGAAEFVGELPGDAIATRVLGPTGGAAAIGGLQAMGAGGGGSDIVQGAAAGGALGKVASKLGPALEAGAGKLRAGAEWLGEHADMNRLASFLPRHELQKLRLAKGPEALQRYASEIEAPRTALGGRSIAGGEYMMNSPERMAEAAGIVGRDAAGRISRTVEDVVAANAGRGPQVPLRPMYDDLVEQSQDVGRRIMPMAQRHAGYLDQTAQSMQNATRNVGEKGVSPPTYKMPFERALQDKRYYDRAIGEGWNKPLGQVGYEDVVDRGVANELRGALTDTLEQRAIRDANLTPEQLVRMRSAGKSPITPEMVDTWRGANRDAHVANLVLDPATKRAAGEFGPTPFGLRDAARFAAGTMTGGPVMGAGTQLAARGLDKFAGPGLSTGQRLMAREFKGFAGDLGDAGRLATGATRAGGAAQLAGRAGEAIGDDGRGQYMGDVVQQSLQQDPQSLGPYAQRFAEAAATRDPMAMASLLEKLDEEEEWRTRYRPALMARTRESR